MARSKLPIARSALSSPQRLAANDQSAITTTDNNTTTTIPANGDSEAPPMTVTSPSDVEIIVLPVKKDDTLLRRSKRKAEESNNPQSLAGDPLNDDEDPLASPVEDLRPRRMNRSQHQQQKSYYYSSSSSVDSYRNDSGAGSYCQSCRSPINSGYRHTINLHHHRNPFYSSFALRPHSHSTVDTSNQFTSPAYINGIVSAKPTTAAIPVEDIHLCHVCSTWFRLHRLQCDECYYVPRMDERYFRHCVRCFEGIVGWH
jgi:hypothetical protein